MKILVIGGGGREHALAWRMLKDESVKGIWAYPGNPGMKITPGITLVPEAVTFDRAYEIVNQNQINLVVIGPEKFLFEGWVNQFRALGVHAFGPTQNAAFLEKSKIRSKQFMKKFEIETSEFEVADDLTSAFHAIDHHPEWDGYVLKLSGPALGKGVIVTKSALEAKKAAEQFFHHRPLGIEEGMVIENLVKGKEVSLFYVCSGERYRFLASACDHKRLKDHDEGPNTGGMGAYSPCSWIDEAFLKNVEKHFVVPTLKGMVSQGTPFSGVLFLGLMVGANGPSLLEYNTRFGDPETQAFLPLLEGDFAALLMAAAKGDIQQMNASNVKPLPLYSLHVVKSAKGYPGLFGEPIESGQEIKFEKSENTDVQVFFAGVKEHAEHLLTSGGRVCGITAVGESLDEARIKAYEAISTVSFSGEHYRKDIGAGS